MDSRNKESEGSSSKWSRGCCHQESSTRGLQQQSSLPSCSPTAPQTATGPPLQHGASVTQKSRCGLTQQVSQGSAGSSTDGSDKDCAGCRPRALTCPDKTRYDVTRKLIAECDVRDSLQSPLLADRPPTPTPLTGIIRASSTPTTTHHHSHLQPSVKEQTSGHPRD